MQIFCFPLIFCLLQLEKTGKMTFCKVMAIFGFKNFDL